jgi:hypothetical protein
MHRCETVGYVPQAAGQSHDKVAVGPWSDHRDFIQSTTVGPHHLLSLYFDRQLSYSSDAINAFAGIIRSYARAERPWYHHFGLLITQWAEPLDAFHAPVRNIDESFVLALLWKAVDMRRRPGFPSWSWSGWTGKGWSQILMAHRFFPTVQPGPFAQVAWVASDGQVMAPAQALECGALEAEDEMWTHEIVISGPMIDVQLALEPDSRAPGHNTVVAVVVGFNLGKEESLKLPFKPDGEPSGITELSHTRCVAIRVAWGGECAVVLLVGQAVNADSMERIGVISVGEYGSFNYLASQNSMSQAKVKELFQKIPWIDGQVRVV